MDGKEILLVIVVCVAVIASFAGMFVGGANLLGIYTCGNYAEITGKETRWVFIDACYIKHEGEWTRWDEYKAINRRVEIAQ